MAIDFRSDTVTRPTPGMRQAMATAEVGDDVLGDDPTVKALESRVAGLLGKEAALFMPSGTMSNQVAIRTHTEPGDEILIEANAHCYYYESGAPAALCGVMCRLLPGVRGIFSSQDVREVLRPVDQHFPRTRLVCLENTHNRGMGSVWTVEQVADVAQAAREAGLRMHLDGARLWNACAASGRSEREYAEHFDSISVCFSKGLGAPIGSALVGSGEFIQRARRFRKQFGGGMRQSGILAAAALYAVENHRKRLVEDHANAWTLADALARLPGIELDPALVQTNIVIFKVTAMPAADLSRRLAQAGILMNARGSEIRAVTHLDVSAADVNRAIELIRGALG